MNIRDAVLILFVMLSCVAYSHNALGQPIHHRSPLKAHWITISDTTTPQSAPEILPSSFTFRKIVLPKNFTNDEALMALFPGRLEAFKGYNEIVHRSYWKCIKCGPLNAQSEYPFESDSVSLTVGNDYDGQTDSMNKDTRFLAREEYVGEDGKHNVFFVTMTNTAQTDFTFFTGRFNCAVVSLARFTEDSSGDYILTSYDPAWDCMGMFGDPLKPKLFQTGPNAFGLKFDNWIMAGGGPIIGDSRIVEAEGNAFNIIFNPIETERWKNVITNFKSKFVTLKNLVSNNRYDILVTTKGVFAMSDWDSSEVQNMPEKLLKFARRHKIVQFITKRYFHCTGSSYALYDDSIDVSIPNAKKSKARKVSG